MSTRRPEHHFGGTWTEQKLGAVSAYLKAYNIAIRHKPSPQNPFVRAYIDAFAGTGYRSVSSRRLDAEESTEQPLLFPDLAEAEPQTFLDGSARLALQVEPGFDKYIYIEKDGERCQALEAMKADFPARAQQISIVQGEANEEIQRICSRVDWTSRRAVLFLDPYGMQVEWDTIRAVGQTRAIDLWLLFPLGIGVTRLLPRSGKIPPEWRRRLDLLLGTADWFDDFYTTESRSTLLGEEEVVVKASRETIGRYFNERLRSVFAGVVDEPGVLRNSRGTPLYLLCFASANKAGSLPALKIAGHLLKGLR